MERGQISADVDTGLVEVAGREATVKVCGVAVGDAAGVKPDA